MVISIKRKDYYQYAIIVLIIVDKLTLPTNIFSIWKFIVLIIVFSVWKFIVLIILFCFGFVLWRKYFMKNIYFNKKIMKNIIYLFKNMVENVWFRAYIINQIIYLAQFQTYFLTPNNIIKIKVCCVNIKWNKCYLLNCFFGKSIF